MRQFFHNKIHTLTLPAINASHNYQNTTFTFASNLLSKHWCILTGSNHKMRQSSKYMHILCKRLYAQVFERKPPDHGQNWSNMLIFEKQLQIYAYVVLW